MKMKMNKFRLRHARPEIEILLLFYSLVKLRDGGVAVENRGDIPGHPARVLLRRA
jgi:hypothetical protein